jgi:hypothetical protein
VLEYHVVAISKPAVGVGVDGDSHRAPSVGSVLISHEGAASVPELDLFGEAGSADARRLTRLGCLKNPPQKHS